MVISLKKYVYSLAFVVTSFLCGNFVDIKIINSNPVTLQTITRFASWGVYGLGEVNASKTHKVAIWAHSSERIGFSLFDGSGVKAGEIVEKAQIQIPSAFTQLNHYDNPAIITAVESFQNWLRKYQAVSSLWSGTTMATALITHDTVTLIHVGDSRIVLERDGQELFSTLDHIKMSSNGFTLERTLGHFGRFDKNKNAGIPSVYRIKTQKGDHLIIASQALWSVFTSDEVANFVYYEYEINRTSMTDIAKLLVKRARTQGCFDPLSILIIEIR